MTHLLITLPKPDKHTMKTIESISYDIYGGKKIKYLGDKWGKITAKEVVGW